MMYFNKNTVCVVMSSGRIVKKKSGGIVWSGVEGGRVEGSVLWLILHNDYKIGLSFKKISIQWNISLFN